MISHQTMARQGKQRPRRTRQLLIHSRAVAVARRLGRVYGLSEREQYLFDVQGWLVVPGVVEPRLLRALNDALDGNQDRFGQEEEDLVEGSGTLAGEHRGRTCRGMLEWPHPHCEPDGSVSRPWEEYDGPPQAGSEPTTAGSGTGPG
jgi:hypothetical protein